MTIGTQDVTRLLAETSAVLLDFNGTLSDDEDLIARLIGDLARSEFGIELGRDRYFEEYVGATEAHMFRSFAAESGTEIDADAIGALGATFNSMYCEAVARNRRVSHAAESFVYAAKERGNAVAVVTAASRNLVVPTLTQIGLLETVDAVVALEDVAQSKPEPDCYAHALELLGCAAADGLAFEDSRTGLAAARAAGLTVVAVGDGLSEVDRRHFTSHAVTHLHPGLFGQ